MVNKKNRRKLLNGTGKHMIANIIHPTLNPFKKTFFEHLIIAGFFILVFVTLFFLGRASVPNTEYTLVLDGNCNYFNVINFLEEGDSHQEYQTYSREGFQNCSISRVSIGKVPTFKVIEFD